MPHRQENILKAQIARIQYDRPLRSALCLTCIAAFEVLCAHEGLALLGAAGIALDFCCIPLERRLIAHRSYRGYLVYCVLQFVSTVLIVSPFGSHLIVEADPYALIAQAVLWVLLLTCSVRRNGKVFLMFASCLPIGLAILQGVVIASTDTTSTLTNVTLGLFCVILFVYTLALIWQSMLQATEQAADRRRAADAAEARSRFFTTVNHEIRTPLNGILGMAQIIKSEARTPDQIDRAASLLESTAMLKALTDDLLDHAKLRAGQFKIRPKQIDLQGLMEDTIALYRDTAADKGLILSTQAAHDIPATVHADPVRLRQVLYNLIDNALKHTRTGGVTLRASLCEFRESVGIELSVTDTGSGIPADRRATIFAPFEQLDDESARAGQGTGLGLFIARDLVEAMAGKIEVSSEPGVGSTFTIRMPLGMATVAEPEADPSEPGFAENVLKGFRVMVVDDSRINRLVARTFLERDGATVVEANDGLQAMAGLRKMSVDAVLMDLHMPKMDGREALRRIRSVYGKTGPKVILLSATDDVDLPLFDSVLSKPLDRQKLIAAILSAPRSRSPAAPVDLRDVS